MLESSEKPVSAENLIKYGALTNVIGGIFVAGAYLLHPPSASPEIVASGLWQVIHVSFMLSLLGGVFALFAFVSSYVRAGGRLLGVIAAFLAITSLIFIFGLDYSEVFIFPTLAITFPEVVIKYGDGTSMPSVAFAFPLSGLLFMVGYVVFGHELKRIGCVSSGSAWALIVGTLIFSAGLSGVFPMLVVRVGAVLFGVGLIWTGLSVYTREKA